MSNYVKATNFTSKDALATGNPLKIIKGTEFDVEFNAIAAAVATKADLASPTFTGVPAAPTATAGTNTTQLATTAFVASAVSTGISNYDTALTVSTSQIEDAAVTSAKLATTGVTAGSYGSATTFPSIDVNAKGQITSASSNPLGFLRLIAKQSVYSATPGNGATISVSLPTSLFDGNTPAFVMFSASARLSGVTDMRYFYMCAGTDSIDNIVLGSSSDDSDQAGTGRADVASTFVLPYAASQDFVSYLYGAALRINVIGYQI